MRVRSVERLAAKTMTLKPIEACLIGVDVLEEILVVSNELRSHESDVGEEDGVGGWYGDGLHVVSPG